MAPAPMELDGNKKPTAAGGEEEGGSVPTSQLAAEQVEVIVHPLVLLSTVDHYNRVAKDTRKRVVGVLLGTAYKGRIDVTNSFAGTCGYVVCGGWVGVGGKGVWWGFGVWGRSLSPVSLDRSIDLN
jgi:hypothetical protein